MPERTNYAHGTPSWTDLATTDQAGAKKFYSAVLGWDYDDQPIGDGQVYSMATVNGKHVAAISGARHEVVPGAPHMMQLECRGAFNHVVAAFLAPWRVRAQAVRH